MKHNRGVTLVELLVVISVIGILAVALGFSYQGWMGSYKVESAVKQLHADLMDARARAMQRNATYLADFPTATTYRIANDLNGNGAIDTAPTNEVQPAFPKTVEYTINGGVLLTFDNRGLISSGNPPPALIDPANPVTIFLTYANTGNTPDYDCVIMSQSRINIGLMNTAKTACNAK